MGLAWWHLSEELGISASKEFLDSRYTQGGRGAEDELKVTTGSILKALELCIRNNFFKFNEQVYQQTGGVGTGIKLAPPFACLGVGKYEKQFFNSGHELLEHILLWKRYIDDVFMLFKGSEVQCQAFVDWLNSIMPGVIKFKYQYSREKIEFLDLEVKIENGRLETNLYVKPSNLQLFLDYYSNHPQHCKEGIVFSQALRIIERCSKNEDLEKNLNTLSEKLIERNYPETLIEEKFQKAKKIGRREILKSRKKTSSDDKVRGIFTHNKANPPLQKWIRISKQVLVKNEKAKKIGNRIQIGWRQSKNLQRLTCGLKGGPKTPPTENPGCFKCGKCRVSCPILKEGIRFSSTNTQKTYRIRHHLTCDSDFVIYLATCQKCAGQYVGKSKTPFKVRHSNHKQEVKREYGGLGKHYGGKGCGYQNLKIQLIDQVEERTLEALAEAEIYWQNQLRSYIQNGGNAHCRRKEKS